MEAKTKLLAVLIVFASTMFTLNIAKAQIYSNATPVTIPGPNHDVINSNSGILCIMQGTATPPPSSALTAFGVNTQTPNYMTDILGNFVGDGVNVSNGGNNAVGYSIGGALNGSGILYPQMFLWHSGDTTSVYCGIHAGYSTPKASAAASYNTYVGNQTGINFAGTGAIWNTAVGYDALLKNTGGVAGPTTYGCKNVAVGDFALQTMQSNLAVLGVGNSNTAVGWASLQLFNPNRYSNCYANTAIGSMALNRTDTGTRNTAVGYQAAYKNKRGTDNVAVGHLAQWYDSAGVANVAVGNWALYNNLTSDNTATGWNALYTNTGGSNNVA